jgi:hypothetical protein
MKTAIGIADALLAQAKQAAAMDGVTLRELVETALRRSLAEREHRRTFRLRRVPFGGRGLQPGVADGSWQHIRDLAYEGHGG